MARNKPLKGMLNAASPIKNTLGEFTKGFYDYDFTSSQQKPFEKMPSISESIPLKPRNPRLSEPFRIPETPSNKNQIIKPITGWGGAALTNLLDRRTSMIRQQVYKKYKK